MDLQMFLTSL